MTDGWHVGRQNIIEFFYSIGFLRSTNPGVWRTIVKWKKEGKIIVRHDGNNRPFVITKEVMQQKLKQSDIILKKR
jgi:hypothetical protein